MNGWKYTKVWIVNEKLVVADTIEDAMSLYKQYYNNNCNNISTEIEITKVEGIANSSILKDYNAIIKETYQYKL